jgi:hypothetical protein
MARSEYKQLFLARAQEAESRAMAAVRQEVRDSWRAIATCYRRMADVSQFA